MKQELECKLKLDDPQETENILSKVGAEFHGEVLEQNWTFDLEGKLAGTRELLRLRITDNNCWGILTHKKPAPEGRYKNRTETETRVENAANTRIILEALGYGCEWFYEKKRRSWQYRGCEIVIDHMPQLGAFIEIEAENEVIIDQLLEELGLDMSKNLLTNYRQIWREHCQKNNSEFCDWKF